MGAEDMAQMEEYMSDICETLGSLLGPLYQALHSTYLSAIGVKATMNKEKQDGIKKEDINEHKICVEKKRITYVLISILGGFFLFYFSILEVDLFKKIFFNQIWGVPLKSRWFHWWIIQNIYGRYRANFTNISRKYKRREN